MGKTPHRHSKRALMRKTGAAAILAATALTAATPAHAAVQTVANTEDREAGLWYADRLQFDELHAAGHTGAGINIAVIDYAINLDAPELAGADVTVRGSYCAFRDSGEVVPATSDDPVRSSHGTAVTAMLVGNGKAADGGLGTRGIVPDAEVTFYAIGLPDEMYLINDNPDGCETWNPVTSAFHEDEPAFDGLYLNDTLAVRQAIEDGADMVVYSLGTGEGITWGVAASDLLRHDIPLIAATPNPTNMADQLQYLFPFSLNGTVAVSGVDNDGNLLHGGGTDVFSSEAWGSSNLAFVSAASELLTPGDEDGWGPVLSSGTSLAAPLVAGTLALGMQAHPDATANQVLQAMIRTTGNLGFRDTPEWVGDQWGYGLANPTALIASEPAALPDENPLFIMSPDDPRCVSDEVPSPQTMDDCAWAFYPTAEQVWTADNSNEGRDTPAESEKPDESPMMPAVLWVVGGLVVAGIIAALIIVPIVRR